MVWTHFWDMSSGGGSADSFTYCYIEAPEDEAVAVFYARFGHNPRRVSCTCCGSDYSISEWASLEQATGYHRGCRWIQRVGTNGTGADGRYAEPDEDTPYGWYSKPGGFEHRDAPLTVEQYIADESVRVIRADEITPDERTTYVPEQGYVWVG